MPTLQILVPRLRSGSRYYYTDLVKFSISSSSPTSSSLGMAGSSSVSISSLTRYVNYKYEMGTREFHQWSIYCLTGFQTVLSIPSQYPAVPHAHFVAQYNGSRLHPFCAPSEIAPGPTYEVLPCRTRLPEGLHMLDAVEMLVMDRTLVQPRFHVEICRCGRCSKFQYCPLRFPVKR